MGVGPHAQLRKDVKHLTAAELVDVLEGHADARLAAHVRECNVCSGELAAASVALNDAAQVDLPEPSPLFWDHFSARVSEAIAHEPQARASWMPAFAFTRFAFAAASLTLVVAAAAGMLLVQSARPSSEPHADAAAIALQHPLDLADDTEWAIVAEVADGMEWDDVAEVGAQPRMDAVESVAATLSDEERAELARLIRHEIERAKS